MPTFTVREDRENLEASIDIKYNRTYKRAFIVTSNDASEFGPVTAYNQIAVRPGFTYANYFGESDFFAVCGDITVQPLSKKADAYRIVCNYGPYNPNLINSNPLDIYPVATYQTVKMRSTFDIDQAGNQVVNSALDPFDPPLERDDSRLILRIRRNEAAFSATDAAQYKDKINSDVFAGQAIGAVKVNDITGDPAWSGEMGLYFVVTYEFEISNLAWGWNLKVLDAGYNVLNGSGDLVPAQLADGSFATKPVPLNGSGVLAVPPPALGSANWLEFEAYGSISFASSFNFTNVIGL